MTIYGDVWRKVHGTITGKPDNFSWLLENKLAGSALPTSIDEVQWAIDQGVKSIITVREEPLDDSLDKKRQLSSRAFKRHGRARI